MTSKLESLSRRQVHFLLSQLDNGQYLKEVFPLTEGQRGLWYLAQIRPDSAAYNLPLAFEYDGRLDRSRFEAALAAVQAEFEVLRCAIRRLDDRPVHLVEPAAPIAVREVDLSHQPVLADAEAEAKALLADEVARPFDLSVAPLLRCLIVRCSGDRGFVALTFHHVIVDGGALLVIARRLARHYNAAGPRAASVEPLSALPFREFVRAESALLASQRAEEQASRWRDVLAHWEPSGAEAEVPPSPGEMASGCSHAAALRIDREAVRRFAAERDMTPFHIFFSAFAILLHRLTGRSDLLIGIPVARRTVERFQATVGFMANLAPMRMRLTGDDRIEDVLRRSRDAYVAIADVSELPFERLRPLLAAHGSTEVPLEHVFAFQTLDGIGASLDGVHWQSMVLPRAESKYGLTFELSLYPGKVGLVLEFDRERWSSTAVQSLVSAYETVLHRILDHSGGSVARFGLGAAPEPLPRPEEQNGAHVDPRTLPEVLGERVAEGGERIAVVDESGSVSYGALWSRSARVAAGLSARGLGVEKRVGLCMGRGADVVVGMLGILRASSAYVPLDPQYPAQRLRYLIEDSGVEVVLTQRALRGDLEALGVGVPLVDIETLEAHDAAAPAEEGAAGPARLAYVIYTSGSTGAPKGVEVTHANVLRLLNTTRKQFGFGAEDVWSCFHSTAFDFSVWEIWGALLHGGRLVMVPHWVARAPRAFCELLREQRVSVLNQTPSAFFQLLQQPGFIESAPGWGLKWVIFGGEALDSRRLARWWSHHGGDGGTRFVNMYGITETTVHVTYGEILDPEKAHRSVGDPLGDLRVYLLDASGQPVPPGAAGKSTWGRRVARGYLGRASLTAERFVPDAFGGAGARLYRSGIWAGAVATARWSIWGVSTSRSS
ncbi:amino acid adenylation domain-containing protein [Burkholderia sp. FERM BP-3421]|uniref:non-ribosomal peptide synthetase n=1 Tax=Burkholderia sp. FERM BP-3421 TaxID=1494466 RepID=UPI0023607978|nr:amino acid adenylation domain-containing protein [Burkholderia sp. FERM BP-3421]WDD92417.1 amino acid adenylation domain-containing protein [Burkholderia sp. FERM BP-3421]